MISILMGQTVNRVNSFFSLFSQKTTGNTAALNRTKGGDNNTGAVYLIGAGTGDVELLTLKAYRLLQQADVVLYDWLVNQDVLALLPKKTQRIFVGKKAGCHHMSQAQICQLMLEQAQQGKQVVRLKGGDPSIFGRLNEETQILTQHNIPFAIVPGITAALGCAAYSGIALTDRDCTQSVRLVTAHLKDQQDQPQWQSLATCQDTLVFYMGLNRIEHIAQQLLKHGMAADMPMAIIDQGTSDAQQVCCATLASIAETVQWQSFSGPALIIVGKVVNKRQAVDLSLLVPNTNEVHR
jgi:uroporphyrin-III C-methyltransferase